MKKLILFLTVFLTLGMTSCEDSVNGEKITPTSQKGDKDYHIKLLFEVDGVKVYRFLDGGNLVYFTNREGETQYTYRRRCGKTFTHHKVETVCN